MTIFAIIPARGGSKGVPGKNIRPLAGKPLIAWTIDAARKSKWLNRIIVSTDDAEIAEVSRQYGAEVPFSRPKELAEDLSHTVDVLLHTLDWLKEKEQFVPDIVVLLPPTAPLRTAKDIDTGVEVLLRTPEADSVRPIIESPKHPYKALKINGAYLEPFFPESITGFSEPYDMPRQALPRSYVYSGVVQVMRRDTLIRYHSLTGKKSAYFFMKPEDSINVDSLFDFQLAESLMKQRLKNEK